jgi:hypothetical protein
VASLKPVYGRVEYCRQKEGDDEPAYERAHLPEEEQRAQYHHRREQGGCDRAHHLRGRGARPPGVLARSGGVRLGRYRFGFCPWFCLRVPLWSLLLVHIFSPRRPRQGELLRLRRVDRQPKSTRVTGSFHLLSSSVQSTAALRVSPSLWYVRVARLRPAADFP